MNSVFSKAVPQASTVTLELFLSSSQMARPKSCLLRACFLHWRIFSKPNSGHTSFGRSEKSVEAIEAFRAKVPEAKNIVIAGGGVEVAGERGEFLNGKPGWFTSESKIIKTNITVVTSGKQLLPALRPSLGTNAEGYLKKVGVKVIYGTSVVSTVPERAGRLDAAQTSIEDVTAPAKVTLSNGEVLDADLYIPAYGLIPNTDWLPRSI